MNRKTYLYVIAACLTIGMAPYIPEPHIWGKLRWIWGGARGMAPLDWWDTVMHGAPWLVLLLMLLSDVLRKLPGLPLR